MATNRVIADAPKTRTLPTANGLKAGAAYVVGKIPCVLLTDAEAASPYNATVQLDGVFTLPVNSEAGAIAVGDILYQDNLEAFLTNTNADTRFGYALEVVGAGPTTKSIKVQLGY